MWLVAAMWDSTDYKPFIISESSLGQYWECSKNSQEAIVPGAEGEEGREVHSRKNTRGLYGPC